MAKMTIAQLREREVEHLASLGNGSIPEAKRIMNSYYRLCGLCEANLYLANCERTCNTKYTAESEAKEERWNKRLNKLLAPYGLELVYFGYFPTICFKGKYSKAISIYFY